VPNQFFDSGCSNVQGPQLQIEEELADQCPSQTVRNSIPPICLDPPFHKIGIGFGEEAFLMGFIREVDKDKPCCNRNDLYEQTLNNLLPVRLISPLEPLKAYEYPLPASPTTQTVHLFQTIRQDIRQPRHIDCEQIKGSHPGRPSGSFFLALDSTCLPFLNLISHIPT
jgi:hypothetical protein